MRAIWHLGTNVLNLPLPHLLFLSFYLGTAFIIDAPVAAKLLIGSVITAASILLLAAGQHQQGGQDKRHEDHFIRRPLRCCFSFQVRDNKTEENKKKQHTHKKTELGRTM